MKRQDAGRIADRIDRRSRCRYVASPRRLRRCWAEPARQGSAPRRGVVLGWEAERGPSLSGGFARDKGELRSGARLRRSEPDDVRDPRRDADQKKQIEMQDRCRGRGREPSRCPIHDHSRDEFASRPQAKRHRRSGGRAWARLGLRLGSGRRGPAFEFARQAVEPRTQRGGLVVAISGSEAMTLRSPKGRRGEKRLGRRSRVSTLASKGKPR